MKSISISKFIKLIRTQLDELGQNDADFMLSDKDSLELDNIIEECALVSIRTVHSRANHKYIDGIPFNPEVITGENPTIPLMASVEVPEDFLRLVSLKMNNWAYPINNYINEASTEYHMQSNPYMCGTPDRPVCALVQSDNGFYFQVFTMKNKNDKVDKFIYVPIPKWEEESDSKHILICEKLINAIIMHTTGQVLLAFNEPQRADVFFKLADGYYA